MYNLFAIHLKSKRFTFRLSSSLCKIQYNFAFEDFWSCVLFSFRLSLTLLGDPNPMQVLIVFVVEEIMLFVFHSSPVGFWKQSFSTFTIFEPHYSGSHWFFFSHPRSPTVFTTLVPNSAELVPYNFVLCKRRKKKKKTVKHLFVNITRKTSQVYTIGISLLHHESRCLFIFFFRSLHLWSPLRDTERLSSKRLKQVRVRNVHHVKK